LTACVAEKERKAKLILAYICNHENNISETIYMMKLQKVFKEDTLMIF